MLVQFKIKIRFEIQNGLTDELSKIIQSLTGKEEKLVLSGDIGYTIHYREGKSKKEIDKKINLFIKEFEDHNPYHKLTIIGEKIL